MRLTPELLLGAKNSLNPCGDREIDLRGLKIPAIENLAIIQDQFDVIDLSFNDIKHLNNIPPMPRIHTLLMHNNPVTRVGSSISNLPNLTHLILTQSEVSSLGEVKKLAVCKKLEVLVLMDSPVCRQQYYRAYVAYTLPNVKVLDYQKISQKERSDAQTLFTSAAGQALLSQMDGAAAGSGSGAGGAKGASSRAPLTDSQKRQVRLAIQNAKTKEEIDHIELQLKTGTFVFAEE
eukprot:gene31626-38221_t